MNPIMAAQNFPRTARSSPKFLSFWRWEDASIRSCRWEAERLKPVRWMADSRKTSRWSASRLRSLRWEADLAVAETG